METAPEKILTGMERYPMCALSGKSETGFRIWERVYLSSQMIGPMTDLPV